MLEMDSQLQASLMVLDLKNKFGRVTKEDTSEKTMFDARAAAESHH